MVLRILRYLYVCEPRKSGLAPSSCSLRWTQDTPSASDLDHGRYALSVARETLVLQAAKLASLRRGAGIRSFGPCDPRTRPAPKCLRATPRRRFRIREAGYGARFSLAELSWNGPYGTFERCLHSSHRKPRA